MSSSFFVFNPFSYDSTSIDVPKEATNALQDVKGHQKHEDFSVLSPKNDKADIMRDVDRDIMAGILFINGVNALDLRKRDKLTKVQLEIHDMPDESIGSMSLEKINALMVRHSKEPTVSDKEKEEINKMVSHIRMLPEEDAREALKSYKESLKQNLRFDYSASNAEKSFNEYTEFLSKHLLRSITDKEEKAFLAATIASNSHQTGFTRAASAQYKNKAVNEFKGAEKNGDSLIEATVDPPKSVCRMECKNGAVSFKEDARFQNITHFKDYRIDDSTQGYYRPKEIIPHQKEGDDYFVRVKSTIFIKAKKTISEGNAKFDKIDLSGDKVFISLKKDNKDAYKLFSRVFVDPRKLWQRILDTLIEKITRRKNEFLDSPNPSQKFKKNN